MTDEISKLLRERINRFQEEVKNGTYVAPNKRGGGSFTKCPDIPPCEFCGRIMYAGICCNKGK